jgi:hypothetical protein
LLVIPEGNLFLSFARHSRSRGFRRANLIVGVGREFASVLFVRHSGLSEVEGQNLRISSLSLLVPAVILSERSKSKAPPHFALHFLLVVPEGNLLLSMPQP